ncbi:hypothetical protein COP2_003881 [Malus domestica]
MSITKPLCIKLHNNNNRDAEERWCHHIYSVKLHRVGWLVPATEAAEKTERHHRVAGEQAARVQPRVAAGVTMGGGVRLHSDDKEDVHGDGA